MICYCVLEETIMPEARYIPSKSHWCTVTHGSPRTIYIV